MSVAAKEYRYQARFPAKDRPSLEEASQDTGRSINQLIVQCVHKALPEVRAALKADNGRVTNVDPLPDAALKRIYSAPERDEAGTRRFVAAQSMRGED
ncbi:MAG: hypothetical protein HOP33_03995 [Verrucomicrobia bacterium]|nr:hypothetical protein [Verrucomicrobiota bacterium]